MSVEKIVADFETCKKAAEIGLELDTVFVHDFNHFKEKNVVHLSSEEDYTSSFPAPTAEEVPLPTVYMQGKTSTTVSYVSFNGLGVFWKQDSNEYIELYIDSPNEATARLKVAIQLNENVPKVRQWYVENGYLNEEQFKTWQEANHERD